MLTATIGTKVSGKSAWLESTAATSYARMLADGCPAGGITDAGRTNAEQWDMWWDYRAGKLKATAAYPGTSKHETGLAVDLDDGALTWVRAHGAAYGWLKDQVANEPWHVEYVAARDTHPTPAQEDDMLADERNMLFHIGALLAETPARTATAVAATPVQRVPGQPSTWLQDTVDGTTAAQATREIVATLPAAIIAALPAGGSGTVSLEQVEAAVKTALTTLTLHATV